MINGEGAKKRKIRMKNSMPRLERKRKRARNSKRRSPSIFIREKLRC